MLKRREFLSFIGIGAVAGPKMAQTVGVEALRLPGLDVLSAVADGMGGGAIPQSSNPAEDIAYGTKMLAKYAARSVLDWDEKRATHYTGELTPNIAALRSVSLNTKLNMARNQAFEIYKQKNLIRYTKMAAGLFNRDDEYE